MRNNQTINGIRRMFGGHTDGDLFRIAVSLGQVPGWTSYRKFGMNDSVGTGGVEDMWPPGTVRVLPTTAGTVSVVSDDAVDNSGGSGARSVTLLGLDEAYREITETITLNGLTPAVGTTSFFRINSAYVATAGAGEVNAGNISMSIGGALQAYIEADQGQTHQTMLTVPVNKSLVITGYRLGVGRMGGSSDAHILGSIKLPTPDSAWRDISDIYLYNGETYSAGDNTATVLPQKTEARLQIISSSATQAFGIIAGYLVDNKMLSQ